MITKRAYLFRVYQFDILLQRGNFNSHINKNIGRVNLERYSSGEAARGFKKDTTAGNVAAEAVCLIGRFFTYG